MTNSKAIQRALISVYYKDGLAPIVQKLHENKVEILSTGGTLAFQLPLLKMSHSFQKFLVVV
jgi:phosphoribosylaminoimidazolecarboxamide formyltransferase/IMP cyclohydrolase